MIGSSADSIDACIIQITNRVKVIDALDYPLDINIKQKLLDLHLEKSISIKDYHELEFELTQCFYNAAKALIPKSKIIKAIGVHGYTVMHQPNSEIPVTVQMVNAGYLSQQLKLPVVSDFRSMDVFSGGQGAPFAPAYHHFLWGQSHPNVAIVNIGGMANVSAWQTKKLIGFDIGPGNVWLDCWARKNLGVNYDKDGAWANTGAVHQQLLKHLLDHQFLQKAPPKSTSRDQFNLMSLEHELQGFKDLKPADVQATLIDLTSLSIIRTITKHVSWCEALYVCGGGAKNNYLMARLKCHADKLSVSDITELGFEVDSLEAAAMAWLAYKRLTHQVTSIKDVTGASSNGVLGSLHEW